MFHVLPKNLLAKGRFFLCLLATIVPNIAVAGGAGTKPADIGEVRVKGGTIHESTEDTSSFTQVIRPTEFDMRMKTTPELLSETAGIDVTNLGGEGQLSTVSIRGSSSEQVAVFLDGVKINAALRGTVDFATIPLDSIERIEVIRSSSSARFGTDAIGGVINIVTKKAGGKRAIDLKLTAGSFETLHTSESLSEPHEDWGLVFSHNHRSTGGDYTFRSAEVTLDGQTVGPSRTFTRLHNRGVAEDILTKVGFDLTQLLHLSILNDFFWTGRQVPGTEEETTLLYPANPLEAEEDLIRNTSGIKFTIDRLFVKNLSWDIGPSYVFGHDHFTDPSPAIGDPIDVTYITHTPAVYSQWTHLLTTPHANLTTTLRYQFSYDTSDDRSPVTSTRLMGAHERQTHAVFIEESLDLFGEKISFIPQARFEDASDRKARASWKAGAVGRPTGWLVIKANVGTSFRYPSFSELFYPDQGYLRGNPNLDDERALSWDAGFILHPHYIDVEFSYFQNRIDNQILFVPVSAVTIEPVNTFKVLSQGVEVTVSVTPVDALRLHANYTWLDTHYSGTDLRLPGRPEHKGNVRATGQIKTRGFFNSVNPFGEVQFVGPFQVNTANTVRISGHTAANLGATVAFAKRFFATLEAKDITNVQIYDARAFPLPRRSYWVTVGAKI